MTHIITGLCVVALLACLYVLPHLMAAERAAMRIMFVALIAVTLALAVLAPLSGAFVAACGLLTLLVPLHHLARAAR